MSSSKCLLFLADLRKARGSTSDESFPKTIFACLHVCISTRTKYTCYRNVSVGKTQNVTMYNKRSIRKNVSIKEMLLAKYVL